MTASPTLAPRYRIPVSSQKKWTRAEYESFVEMGAFTRDDRIELLEGVIVEKIPQKAPHSSGIRFMEKELARIFTEGYDIRTQMPLSLGEDSVPEPDIAVVGGSMRDYVYAHPTTAALVVEIADSSAWIDRKAKSRVYARAGIPEYVILNLPKRRLKIRRNPAPLPDNPLEFDYADVTLLTSKQKWSPLLAPDAVIAVADLLP